MDLITFFVICLVGAWLLSRTFEGRGFGFAGNLVIGVLCVVIGSYLISLLFGTLIMAAIGILVLIGIVLLVKKLI